MVSIDDMKSCIQEWMGQALLPSDLARIYADISLELERQLDICMGCLIGKGA